MRRNHLENGDVIELRVRKEEGTGSRAKGSEEGGGDRYVPGINWEVVLQLIGFLLGLWFILTF